jgi:glycosyltransferase involved in cell wall biosynthesis
MKIAIFETEHFEVTHTLIRLFDQPGNQLTVFVYEKSYHQLQFLFKEDMSKYNWIIKTGNESRYRFMRRLYKTAKKEQYDLLYLNTIADNHILYGALVLLLKKIRIVMTIHDINGFFTYIPSLNIKRLLRYTGKRMLVKYVNEFNVIAASMAVLLKDKLPAGKKVHCLPGGVYNTTAGSATTLAAKSTIQIIVPGTVDYRRRDYGLLFQLLAITNRQSLPVTITLLGGFDEQYGREIHEQCRQYATQHNNLLFYDTAIVDQPEFDRVMTAAHLVWVPSMRDVVINDGVTETYGVSICSGNIFDIIRFAKPFIAPAGLITEQFIDPSCLRYTKVEDIVAHLQHLYNHPDTYHRLHDKAVAASLEYTVDKVRARNKDLFELA